MQMSYQFSCLKQPPKIPPNLPFPKGGEVFPPFLKGGEGGLGNFHGSWVVNSP